MILRKEIEIFGSKGSRKLIALFDSGATYSIISKNTAQQVEIFTPLPQPKKLKIADGNFITITHAVRIDFKINGITLSDEFLVVEDSLFQSICKILHPNDFLVFEKLPEDVIPGASTMQKWRIKLDFENENVIINPDVAKLVLY